MSRASPTPELPRWLLLVGSGAIGFHFFALLMVVIAVRSGPWPSPFGPPSPEDPPKFAESINERTRRYYLQPLQMDHDYHFSSNRTDFQAVYFEAKLKDDKGEVVQTLRFPQDDANFWVHDRQNYLAQSMGEDDPIEPPRGEEIPAPGKKTAEVEIWDAPPGQKILQLRKVPEHLIPRDRGPVFGPSAWSQLLARSYSQYLCRQYGASAVELIRHSRDPLNPTLMFVPPPPGYFEEVICSYGDFRLEK